MKIPITNVRNAKAQKVRMITKKSGGAAKSAKEPEEGRNSRARIILAPDVNSGRRLVELLGWYNVKIAIVTEPAHLTGIAVYPNEDIYLVIGAKDEFLPQLITASSMFGPGDSFNLKIYNV